MSFEKVQYSVNNIILASKPEVIGTFHELVFLDLRYDTLVDK
jgi:hypothetical protein